MRINVLQQLSTARKRLCKYIKHIADTNFYSANISQANQRHTVAWTSQHSPCVMLNSSVFKFQKSFVHHVCSNSAVNWTSKNHGKHQSRTQSDWVWFNVPLDT